MLFFTTDREWHLFLTTCFTLLLNFPIMASTGKCLTSRKEVFPKRYIHFEGRSLSLAIESSSRPTHQVTSYIFKIFVQEVLGYPNVNVVDVEDNFDMDEVITRLSGLFSEIHVDSIPTSMINLEVWVPPHKDIVHTLQTKDVKGCGVLRPMSRFGWFIPKNLARNFDSHINYGSVPWTIFKSKNSIKSFQISDRNLLQYIEKLSMLNIEKKIYFCNDIDFCDDGYYVPEICVTEDCALLLAPNFNDTRHVIEHIQKDDLRVKVLWLGYNLKAALKVINETYSTKNIDKSVVILNWSPSEIIYPEENFLSVDFKQCDPTGNNETCRYEMMKIEKFAWNKLEKLAYPVYESLLKMQFSDSEYEDLLEIYLKSKGKNYQEIACEWLKKYESKINEWTILSVAHTPEIYIGGIFPIQSNSYKGNGIVRAAKLAVKAANKYIFSDYTLKLLVTDGQCRAEKVMKAFIDYIVDVNYFEKLVGVLGPACSETVEPIAAVSKLLKTMVISYSAEGASFSDREKYPYFFRTIGSNTEFMYVYLELMKQMGWKRVAALTEDGQKYTEYLSLMQSLLEHNGISFIANVKFPRERKGFSMTSYLEALKKKRARIIIADINDEAARSVMCEAHKLKMTMKDGYVWFLPTWLNLTWYNTDFYNQEYNETINCTSSVMINAINGYFSITHAFWAPENATMQENMTVSRWREAYMNQTKDMSSDYAGFAYDAVWTYALALDKLIKNDPEAMTELHSQNTTDKLVRYVQETDFNGVSGRIKFRGGPSRFSTIHLIQWYNGTRNIVGYFEPNVTDNSSEILGGVLRIKPNSIIWTAGQLPDDGTEPPESCTLAGLAHFFHVSCEFAVIILNGIILTIAVGVISVASWCYKRKMEKKMSKTQRYMEQLGLDPNMTTLTDFDKWEVPREHVVINRRLGQGAFGTVYGGEALIDPENGWVAVAVKTLKMGSTAEEKIDFLSEAEAMKRFDHKNIVKLLGLCTRNEPVYTIMEFMLYGDLKTFLLDRRHLVRMKSEENAEVSSKKLTSMALDVARGLSYLAEMKYVHRDVAARNCLVNASRVVKLGDFGMTRAMYENDYYKFNRKGMLPVRWMAPESLSLGLFSTGSDIWSFGVLMYEIITFGSFPFQGMSNNQVLEYVKNKHTLDIPNGVKPQLEVFLKSCWNQDSNKRPKASEIVEFLANNPQLISPCLEGPISSIEMECTDDLEMHLPSEFRKQSSVTSRNFSNGDIARSQTIHITDGDMIQLEHVSPKEPLLKGSVGGSTGYVTLQTSQPDLLSDSDIDYSHHNIANGSIYRQYN